MSDRQYGVRIDGEVIHFPHWNTVDTVIREHRAFTRTRQFEGELVELRDGVWEPSGNVPTGVVPSLGRTSVGRTGDGDGATSEQGETGNESDDPGAHNGPHPGVVDTDNGTPDGDAWEARSDPIAPAGWWEGLTPLQLEWYGAYIDSRVRLLGESYPVAVRSVRISDACRDDVLGKQSR